MSERYKGYETGKTIKAVVTDVDGTILANPEGLPSYNVKKEIYRIQKKGIYVGISTGRSLKKTEPIFKNLKLNGPSSVSNGAQIINSETKELYAEYPIDEASLERIWLVASEFPGEHWIQDNSEEINPNTQDYAPHKPFIVISHRVPLEVADNLVHSISEIPNVLPQRSPVYESNYIDIFTTHPNSTKQHAILKLSQILQIDPNDIMGIGDGYNDLPLLMACGLKVAVENAVSDLKEIADYIAPSVTDDGFAYAVKKFIR